MHHPGPVQLVLAILPHNLLPLHPLSTFAVSNGYRNIGGNCHRRRCWCCWCCYCCCCCCYSWWWWLWWWFTTAPCVSLIVILASSAFLFREHQVPLPILPGLEHNRPGVAPVHPGHGEDHDGHGDDHHQRLHLHNDDDDGDLNMRHNSNPRYLHGKGPNLLCLPVSYVSLPEWMILPHNALARRELIKRPYYIFENISSDAFGPSLAGIIDIEPNKK